MKASSLTLKELRLIAKKRNIDKYQNMSKDQLINLINTPKLLERTQIKKIMSKLLKKAGNRLYIL